MRVLMFGWEFPPHIAGGLGTACYGIVKGLAYNGVQTLFVMPSASGDEDQSAAKIINASDVPVESFDSTVDEFLDKVKFVRIGSNMIPYVDPEEFHEMVESERRLQSENLTKCIGTKFRFQDVTAPILWRRSPTMRWSAARSLWSTGMSSTSSTPTTG